MKKLNELNEFVIALKNGGELFAENILNIANEIKFKCVGNLREYYILEGFYRDIRITKHVDVIHILKNTETVTMTEEEEENKIFYKCNELGIASITALEPIIFKIEMLKSR